MMKFLLCVLLSSLILAKCLRPNAHRSQQFVRWAKRTSTDPEPTKVASTNSKSKVISTNKKTTKKTEKSLPASSRKNTSSSNTLDLLKELLTDLDKLSTGEDMSDLDIDLDSIMSKKGDKLQQEQERQTKLLNSVIRVHCTHSAPNYNMPWQRQKQDFSTSTGFILPNKQILTNAHAVEYGSLIQVKKRQSEKKFSAYVTAVSHECDLAVLAVEDDAFWNDVEALAFGELPDLFEDVSVVGYPIGGDSVSITSGVVSRIEMQEYVQASAQLLAIQIDAAINPGNSGGPVVNADNKVIGVAFQSLSSEETENIGYVIPVPVIRHFLEDVEKNGRFSGVCGLGVRLQGLESDSLRRHCGMKDDESGILLTALAPLSPAANVLKVQDVILAVDGIKVANDGSIPFREGSLYKERVSLSYYFTLKFPGDLVKLDVLRNGKRLTLSVPLCAPTFLVQNSLLKNNHIDVAKSLGTGNGGSIVGGSPSYLVIGGLVFIALSQEYLQSELNLEHMSDHVLWGDEFRILALADTPLPAEDEEVVLLSQVIAHNCNIGYERNRNLWLKKINGESIRNLRHLHAFLQSAAVNHTVSSLVFEFSNGQIMVLDKQAAQVAQDQVRSHPSHPHSSYCSSSILIKYHQI